LSLGSGEGLVEAYMELVEETDGGGKTKKVKRQVHRGALFTLDEGQALGEIASRKGSTLLPVLRTAWSGGDPGQANASVETRRSLRPNSYAVGLISAWQNRAATALLADSDGGTPQRFVWLPTTDLGSTYKGRPDWPGVIPWTPPPMIEVGGIMQPHPLGIDDEIADEIGEARAAVLRCEVEENPLDAHRRLNKLKVAGVLAVLDGRHHINVDDWRIAEHIMSISDSRRDWVLSENRRQDQERASAEIARAIMKDASLEKSAVDRALRSAARAAWRATDKASPEPVTKTTIRYAIASRDRQKVSVDEAIAEAERLEWIAPSGAGFVLGKARPA
jgi:hypothetical protein